MTDQFDKNFYFINHTVVLWCSIGDTAEHSDPFLFSGIGKKPIMSYFCKVLRKHVKKEPSDMGYQLTPALSVPASVRAVA